MAGPLTSRAKLATFEPKRPQSRHLGALWWVVQRVITLGCDNLHTPQQPKCRNSAMHGIASHARVSDLSEANQHPSEMALPMMKGAPGFLSDY
jgi:hypothetical protein